MATILIVDDARSTLRALEVILKREGYTVLTAVSGEEGLTCIEQQDVDLLLCDVKMPKMDGLTVLRQVKAQDAGLAVVMMSGHGDIAAAVSAMKEGRSTTSSSPLAKRTSSAWSRKPWPCGRSSSRTSS